MTATDLEVRLDPTALAGQMRKDVRAGLAERPRTLPPTYFYDAEGSRLFEEITRLEEYYPTRTERAILTGCVDEVAVLTRAETLVELGSGTSEKTRILLSTLRRAGSLREFVPFDVDPFILDEASAAVAAEFPGLEVRPVVGDFEHHLTDLPGGGRTLIAFLGSTIGNLVPAQRAPFFDSVRTALGSDGHLLLGLDLVKDPGRLVAAYDDSHGVTAAFNKNVLVVLDRELGADFDPERFEHVARWDVEQEWIEMRLRSTVQQRVQIPGADLVLDLEAGEEIRTEISAKFRRESISAELADHGLAVRRWWTDPADDFAVALIDQG